MKLERDDAKIGLLVLLALALFLGFLFQRSLAAILSKEWPAQVRLENASDVAEGTEVQLQGLRVGTVKRVDLQRDGVRYRFLAHLGLRADIVLWQGTTALVVAKPLGGSYVDLLLPPPPARQAVLAPGSVLDGRTGASLATLVEESNKLVANLNLGVDEVRGSLKGQGLGAVLDHPQIRQTLASLQATLGAFGKLAQDGQGLVRHGDASLTALDRDLASLDHSLDHVRKLLDTRSGDLDTIVASLAGTLKEAEALARDLNARLARSGASGEEALKALERDLKSAEELLELLKAKPNRLVWGKSTPEERAAAARKVEEARRAQGAKP